MVLRQCVQQHLGLQGSIKQGATQITLLTPAQQSPAILYGSLGVGVLVGSHTMVHLWYIYTRSAMQYHARGQQHFLDAVFPCGTYIHEHVFLLAYF